MKLSILASALITSTATAAPSSSKDSTISARADVCWSQNIVSTTDSTISPLAADCTALANDETVFASLPGGVWIPTDENDWKFGVSNGTCGIKGSFNPAGGSLPASEMTIRRSLVSGALNYAVSLLAVDERVSATGSFACMIPGMTTKTGWVKWEIYNAGGGGNGTHV
ncbi:hypothetical protein V8F20_009545 [Naviculisporaceae sp. PSN 640]